MTFQFNGPILLAGAGKMGGALIEGLIAKGLDPKDVIAQDPQLSAEQAAHFAKLGVSVSPDVTDLPRAPSVLLVAVKPQIMDQVFPKLAKLAGPETLVISIAAGRPIAGFEAHLAPGSSVVRAMPNTPAAIGRGITVCVPNAHVTQHQRDLCDGLLASVGQVAWVAHEDQMDAATAVSGSGPAYVFLLAECLARAGVEAGLDAATAAQLANATVAGAGELIHRSSLAPSKLRENVTSPGGTTAAALSILMAEPGLQDLMTRAVAAATNRGRALAK